MNQKSHSIHCFKQELYQIMKKFIQNIKFVSYALTTEYDAHTNRIDDDNNKDLSS